MGAEYNSGAGVHRRTKDREERFSIFSFHQSGGVAFLDSDTWKKEKNTIGGKH
jgi:hypothetical protein